jgi:hypothetical protein
MALRRHIRVILLSPLLISFSIASWILDLIEGTDNKTAPQRKANNNGLKKEFHSDSVDIEVGLIEELEEERLAHNK